MIITHQERIDLIDRKLAELSEHFDHIQILISFDEAGTTQSLARGATQTSAT